MSYGHNLKFWDEDGKLIDADLFGCCCRLRQMVNEFVEHLVIERGAGEGDLLAMLSELRDEIGEPVWFAIKQLREKRIADAVNTLAVAEKSKIDKPNES